MKDKIIIIPHGVALQLRKDFNVAYPTIRQALRGQTNTPLARMLRVAALQRGGLVAVKPN